VTVPGPIINVGVIADTHGLLRPQARAVLASCDRIVHAGDIGDSEILTQLGELAPLSAIRGNVDTWATELPDCQVLDIEGRRIYVLHDLKQLNLDPTAAGFDVVISGHSHQPRVANVDGVLYLNPGSAGPRRFRLPVVLAQLEISSARIDARIIQLAV
jgi:putative phosphoesterase